MLNYDNNYSVDAIITRAIHDPDNKYIYVEGEDDYIFLEEFREYLKINNFVIEHRDGKEGLKKIIEKILVDDTISNIFVFQDRDYDFIIKKAIKNHKIIYSTGHSIENTLCCEKAIVNVYGLSHRSKMKKKETLNLLNEELKEFENKISEILLLAIINEKKKNSKDYSAYPYLKNWEVLSDKNGKICPKKIEAHSKKHADNYKISAVEKKDISKIIKNMEIRKIIAGHILMGFVKYFILKGPKNIKLSESGLFTMLLSNCMKCFATDPTCLECKYYIDELIKIQKSK